VYSSQKLIDVAGASFDILGVHNYEYEPEDWTPGTIDAIATSSANGDRIVIKAVDYAGQRNTLLVRLQGSGVPERAEVLVHDISAGLEDAASLERPDAIGPPEPAGRLRA
jgi:hypothetical protein